MTRIVVELSNTVTFATATPWNYNTGLIANGQAVGTILSGLLDDTGAATTVNLETVTAFSSSNASTGFATADNSWPKEVHWVNWVTPISDPAGSSLKFTNLPTGATFSLKIAGQNTQSRNTTYSVGATSVTYTAGSAAAVPEPVEITGTVDGTGEIVLLVTEATAGDLYGYISGLELVYAATPSTTYTIDSIDGDNDVQAGQPNVDIVMTATTGVTSVTLGGETLTINGVS